MDRSSLRQTASACRRSCEAPRHSAGGGGCTISARCKSGTGQIPIAFQTGADALQSGLVNSLDHPETNLTGINEIAGPLVTDSSSIG
jgi:ABC-type uncharacterized transport system substrate-binding protein